MRSPTLQAFEPGADEHLADSLALDWRRYGYRPQAVPAG